MKKVYQIIIPPTAKESLRDIIVYIKKESPVAAARVRKELIKVVKSLSELPERFSKEEYLLGKSGNYHSVARWHYKIEEDKVVVLRFIHSSRNPELIKKIV